MKSRRFTALILTGIMVVLFAFGVELHYAGAGKVPFLAKLVLLLLLDITVLALLVLIFFVVKSLVKVYLDRKRRVPGYRFKTKIVVIIVVLTMIPSSFLFVVSSGVVTNYLDKWFEPQIKQPLSLSIEIAKSAYDMQRRQVLAYAEAMAAGRSSYRNYTVRRLSKVPANASETIKAAFAGKAGVEVISGDKGDVIRAAAPEYSGGKRRDVLVVESLLSRDMSRNAEKIRDAYQNYLTLDSLKAPLKTNYLLILSFVTLLTIFMALWVALRISRGITDPIQVLAQATEEVAKGNLNTVINLQREDEIGLLVESFNNMVSELRDSKDSLQSAWTESDRRRLIIENILENINSGVLSLDTAGNILTVNTAACVILGISPEEIVGKNYSTLLSMLQSEELKETVRNIRVSDFKGLERELRVTVGDRRVLLRIFITTLGDQNNFWGTLVVFDDLSEIVRAQKALAWQEVARRIAHEIKNPLTPIKLSTDHMIKKWQNGDDDFGMVFERSTRTIIKEVESLRRLVNEFSRFGKMPEIKKAPVLISSIIEGVVNLYSDFKGVQITVSKAENEQLVELDAEQFKRVIINIVDNAMQAMHETGKIDIAVSHDIQSNRAYVDISDNGPGIPEEDKEKLFLPYFSTRKDGTGLGLAIASKVVTDHHGYIRIRDNKPTGSVFTIELPIKEA